MRRTNTSMRKIASMLLAAACAASVVVLPAEAAPAKGVQAEQGDRPNVRPSNRLKRLRRATANFEDPRVGERDGYIRSDTCWEFPYTLPRGEPLGAMGYHYVNERLVNDPKIQLLRPEILVYVPDGKGGRELGAVEYFRIDRDQRIATSDDRPKLLGHELQGPR